MILLRAAAILAVFAAVAPVAAAPLKQTIVASKVGRSNVQIRIVVHPQADFCTKALAEKIKARARELGEAHVRENLKALIKKAGTDASGPTQFFGVAFLAGCPKDGSAWVAFPAEGKDKLVSRFAPELGWSPMMKL
ncbi:hypothetical protein ACFOWB_09330 [Chenggangzhangella methanolivorans]|uniref:hypothetical protein n=1 Tax=Chenggangzhangella methanolivorans TaxID=1437009 RepID=UPI003622F562